MSCEYKRTFTDYLDDHPVTGMLLTMILPLICVLVLVIVGMVLLHNFEIAELNEKARICTETGYGCESNTVNKDIKYDNTPIVEVNNETKE